MDLPETVHVLGGVGADGVARVERREATDGGGALLAYSSLAALVRCCGPRQGWVAMRRDDVGAVVAELGISRIVLDLALPPPPMADDDEPVGSFLLPALERRDR